MRNIIILISLVILSSCATAYKMNKVSAGMTKTQVIQSLGYPTSSSGNGDTEFLIYSLYANDDDAVRGIRTEYFVKIVDMEVVSYGKMGDFDSTKDPTLNLNVRNK